MRQLVADAENYLTSTRPADPETEPYVTSLRPSEADADDAESLRSAPSRSESEAAFGPLRHSDSLLLISQVSGGGMRVVLCEEWCCRNKVLAGEMG